MRTSQSQPCCREGVCGGRRGGGAGEKGYVRGAAVGGSAGVKTWPITDRSARMHLVDLQGMYGSKNEVDSRGKCRDVCGKGSEGGGGKFVSFLPASL